MKWKALFISFSFLVFFQVGFAQKSEQAKNLAMEFNDYCSEITDSLYYKGVAWGQTFGQVHQDRDFKRLSVHRKALLRFIENSQKALINKKVEEEMEDLKVAVLDFLAFEKGLITEAFLPFEALTADASDDAVQERVDFLTAIAEKETAFLQNVQRVQEEMASLYGYTIEEVPEPE